MPERKEEEPLDPLPALIAEIDQALKMMPQQARASKTYYDSLREQGFGDKQALYLTAAYWRAPEAPSDDA